jgi:hypothetical protein
MADYPSSSALALRDRAKRGFRAFSSQVKSLGDSENAIKHEFREVPAHEDERGRP